MKRRLFRSITVLSLATLVGFVGATPALAAAPTITSFSPTSGTVGTAVIISGTAFGGATSVTFNGTSGPTYVVNTTKKITAHVPSGATSGPISVTTASGSATSATGFTVLAGPAITLSKGVGPPRSSLKVSGTGFGPFEGVDIFFDTTDEALAGTDGFGAFSDIALTVPGSAEPGTRWISAEGRHSGLFAQTIFTVRTDWPQFRFSNKHSGRNPTENMLNTGNVSGIDLDWSYATGDIVSSSPAVANGVVYLGAFDQNIYAFDLPGGSSAVARPEPFALKPDRSLTISS